MIDITSFFQLAISDRFLHGAGLEKRFALPCMNSEVLQASVDKDSFPTCVNAAARELNRQVLNFLDLASICSSIAQDVYFAQGLRGKKGE